MKSGIVEEGGKRLLKLSRTCAPFIVAFSSSRFCFAKFLENILANYANNINVDKRERLIEPFPWEVKSSNCVTLDAHALVIWS